MQNGWIHSSTLLPSTDAPIEFLLDDRLQPLRGRFVDGVFHSRWGNYAAIHVASWRQLEGDRLVALMNSTKVMAG